MNPRDLLYSQDHDWIRVEGDIATIGITDYAQGELGDVVFIELPEIGATFDTDQILTSVESVKAVSEIFAPVSGEVVEVNPLLNDTPEVMNSDPYGKGWIAKIRMNKGLPNDLLTPEKYDEYIKVD